MSNVPTSGGPEPAAPPRILVVDDEEAVAEEVAAGLRSLGYVASFTTSAGRAREILRADPSITVLVSDIRMPDCSGLDLAQAVLAERSDSDALSVVLITANAHLSDAIDALRHGVSDFVRKPFRCEEIGTAVREAHRQAADRRLEASMEAAKRARLSEMVNQNATLSSRLALMSAQQPEIEKSLAEALASRTLFLALVSHELRTPLVAIIGFAELLASGSITNIAQVREYAMEIHEAGRHQQRLIDNMLLLTQLSTGELKPALEELPAKVLISAALAEFPVAVAEGLIVDRSNQAPGLRAAADRVQAVQVLVQLLTNSLRYATPASPIEVAAESSDGEVRFEITDRGPGIPQHVEAAVGVPFVQGEMAFSRSQQGLGLGLAIASRLAAVQGGRLTIHARPGGGTEATLHLLRC